METKVHGRTLGQIAAMVGGELSGPPDLKVSRPVPAGSDDPEGITFAESDAYLAKCLASRVGAMIVKKGTNVADRAAVFVDHPRTAFGIVLASFVEPLPITEGVHPTALVSELAEVHPSAAIGAYAVVERGAQIGAGCRVFPFAYIGESCTIGEGTVLYPQVVLYQDVKIGSRCIVHAGAVLGADGFGFIWDGSRQFKVPQVGGVRIGDDVEIGAGSCVDRATCGDTVIENGTKLDNLVQVAHNVAIGRHTVIAAHAGIGGSSHLGDNVVLGGDVAVSDHVEIASGAVIGGRSGAFQDIKEPGHYHGTPPVPVSHAMRVMALQNRLPELFKRIKQLEDEIESLKQK